MTTYPNLLDAFTNTLLGTAAKPENPHHRALLNAFTTVQHLEARLLDVFAQPLPEDASQEKYVEEYTELLLDRLAAGYELSQLMSAPCWPAADSTPAETPCEPCEFETDADCCRPSGEEPDGLLDACLDVFCELGDPDALASADLVDALRRLPGTADGRWSYADLTQARLAQLLAPYEIQTRDITLPDGRRRKSYRRTAFTSAAWSDGLC